MITNPQAKRVIFYGDSITSGKAAGRNERLASNVRFTGIVQRELGADYDVVEEGLRARNLVGENPFFPDRNGLETFDPIMFSQMPADIVVLQLGANDCNAREGFDAATVADSLAEYVSKLTACAKFLACPMPKVFVMLPHTIKEEYFDELLNKIFAGGAASKVVALRTALQTKADELGLPTFDADTFVKASEADGIHLEPEDNERLGVALAKFIRSL